MGGFWDANYTITKLSKDARGEINHLEINHKEIPMGSNLEDNKTATIDVSTYTEPIEIEPSEGKDGMKKATVTLSNIPSGGASKLYAWGGSVAGDKVFYSTVGDLSSVADNAQFSIQEDSPLGLALCIPTYGSIPSDPDYNGKMGFDSIEYVTSDWDDSWLDDVATKVSNSSFYFRLSGEDYALMTRVPSLDIDLAQALPRVVHN